MDSLRPRGKLSAGPGTAVEQAIKHPHSCRFANRCRDFRDCPIRLELYIYSLMISEVFLHGHHHTAQDGSAKDADESPQGDSHDCDYGRSSNPLAAMLYPSNPLPGKHR